VLERFLLDLKGAEDFSDKSRIEKLTGKNLITLDADFRDRIASWEKNTYVGGGQAK
jgi:hypothetical protein